MQPGRDIGERLEQAGDRVGDVAAANAQRGWEGLQPLLEFKLLTVSGVSVTLGGVLFALLTLVAGWALSTLLRRALRRYGERHGSVNAAALYTISRVVHYLVLVVAVLLALELVGIPLSKFTLFAGAIGVGLGFGLQAIFSNFISGLILLFDRSLKVGDFIQLDNDVRGIVKAINIRSTQVTTNDNIDVLVPNSEFINGRVTNWTHRSVNRRMRVPFQVGYGVDKELVKKAALEAAEAVPFTLAMDGEKAPQVWLSGFGDNGVDFLLAVWLTEAAARRNAAVRAAYLWELDTAMRRYGIERPFPQRDLHLRSAFGLRGEEALAALRGDTPVAGDAQEPHALGEDEHRRLARNDAQHEAQRQMAEDAAELPPPEDAAGEHADHEHAQDKER